MSTSASYSIDDLLVLMKRLREPGTGCPWDLEQSYGTIAPSTIEEAYEVVDAIEKADFCHLKEELGDLLFQVIFYSQLGQEDGYFTFAEIVSDLVAKLVRRHPHVFPDGTLQSRIAPRTDADRKKDEQAIKKNWEELKKSERRQKGKQGILDDVPVTLPALSRAAKLQKRAASVGFDWPALSDVIDKLEEEIKELKEAVAAPSQDAIAEEMGDLLFTAVNLSRHLKLDPESVLRAGNSKFERRFQFIEKQLQDKGLTIGEVSLNELDQYWRQAKSV